MEESQLKQYFYFELDETERGKLGKQCRDFSLFKRSVHLCFFDNCLAASSRHSVNLIMTFFSVNVNRAKDFASSIKQEMMMERQNLESAKRQHGQDTPVEYMAVSSVFKNIHDIIQE